MTVTEIGVMGVKAGVDVMDPSRPEGMVIPKAYHAVTAHPEGPHRASWGLDLEDPLKVWCFFDFDTVDHHATFANRCAAEIVKDLPTVLSHGGWMKHVAFSSPSKPALTSSLAEVVVAHFPKTIGAGEKDAAVKQLEAAAGQGLRDIPGFQDATWGWSEEHDFPVIADEKQTGQALVLLVGWSGLDAQKASRESEAWKAVEAALKGMDGRFEMSSFRVSCLSAEE
ncbi:hypothetical protein CPLU01_12576 [Colletotrichum plurivorum]|uniref:Uncharacterized protein n=1 Tax=Colletotrichum plurivorum TaxID=2175906 RepID=A0A8H6N5Q0_9PEZI|nr:hypothetical protein CPLU01_12576 [Colletotrichum plurivorum]